MDLTKIHPEFWHEITDFIRIFLNQNKTKPGSRERFWRVFDAVFVGRGARHDNVGPIGAKPVLEESLESGGGEVWKKGVKNGPKMTEKWPQNQPKLTPKNHLIVGKLRNRKSALIWTEFGNWPQNHPFLPILPLFWPRFWPVFSQPWASAHPR